MAHSAAPRRNSQLKTIQFDLAQLEELEELRSRLTRRRTFSDAVRVAVEHGLNALRQQSEIRLVA